jgi:hypothetical protein
MKEPLDLVSRWSRWVDEVTAHPLDRFEYEGLLECRDRIAEGLGLIPSDDGRLDEIDARFEDLTVNRDELMSDRQIRRGGVIVYPLTSDGVST